MTPRGTLVLRVAVVVAGAWWGSAATLGFPGAHPFELLAAVGLYVAAHAALNVELPGRHRLSATMLVLVPLALALDGRGLVLPCLLLPFTYRVLRKDTAPLRAAYNVAQLTISVLAAEALYRGLHAHGSVLLPRSLAAIVLALGAYQVVNAALVSLWRAPEERQPLVRVFVRVLTSDGHYAVWAVYSLWPLPALLLAHAYGYWGLAVGVVCVLPAPHFLRLYGELSTTRHRMLLDELTHVYNYRYFAEWLRREAPRLVQAGTPVSLVVIDCDQLKQINDRHGHQAGNAVLRDLAGRLRQQLRAGDALVRFGGDEFVAILAGVRSDEAVRVAARLRRAIGTAAVAGPDGQSIPYSASVGYAVFPDDTDDLERLFVIADRRMYEEKHAG